MGQLGATIEQIGLQEQDRVNTNRAEAAFNDLRKKQMDLTLGDDGFTKKQGADAVTQPTFKTYSDRLTQATADISSTLGNDVQRREFERRAGVSMLQFQGDLLNHLQREQVQYQKQTNAGIVATESQSASAHWQDPNAILTSMERVDAAINSQGKAEGWSKPYLDAQRLEAESKIHTAVIGQALAQGNYIFAQNYYDKNKDGLTATAAAEVSKAVLNGEQKQMFNGYRRGFIDSRDSIPGLNALEESVTKDDKLDEARQNVLLNTIASRRDVLEKRLETQRTHWVTQTTKQINEVNSNTMAGFEPTLEQLGPLITATKNTELEGDVQRAVSLAGAVKQFRLMGPRQRADELANMEAQVRQDPTKFDRSVITNLRTLDENIQKQVKDEPILFATRQGLREPNDPALQPLDLSKPDQLGPNLAARFALNRELIRSQGAAFKPLQSQEVGVLKQVLEKLDPSSKSAYFGSLAKSTGGDMEGYKAMMQQLAPDDPVTATGGIYAARGLISNQGRVVADSIFRGQQYMNPPKDKDGKPIGKVVPLPQEKDMIGDFNSYAGRAFEGKPEARNIYFQTARAIYADMVVNKGDYSGNLDSSSWKASVALATGGIDSYRGNQIVLPYGNDVGQFKDGLKLRVNALVAAGRLPPGVTTSDLMDLPAENEGDGRYILKSGDRKMLDKDGNTIIIDFNQQPDVIATKPTPAAGVTRGYNDSVGGAATGITRTPATGQVLTGGTTKGAALHEQNIRAIEAEMAKHPAGSKQRAILQTELDGEKKNLAKFTGSGGGGGTITQAESTAQARSGLFGDADREAYNATHQAPRDNSGTTQNTGSQPANREQLIGVLMKQRGLTKKQAMAVADSMLKARGGQ